MKENCRFERISNVTIGFFLLLIAAGFFVISVTVLPVFGLIVALPVLLLSGLFLRAKRSPECLLTA